MSDEGNEAFHIWLRTQFFTLDEARCLVWRWMNEWDQMIPKTVSAEFGYENCGFTMRAMAHHASLALEGREVPDDQWYATSYLESKHGPDLYSAMCGKRPPCYSPPQR